MDRREPLAANGNARGETESIHGLTMMMPMVECAVRTGHQRANHDDVGQRTAHRRHWSHMLSILATAAFRHGLFNMSLTHVSTWLDTNMLALK